MDMLKTADEARRLLRGFTAVSELAAAFENAGSLEQAAREAQARLDALKPQIEAATAQVQALKAEADAVRTQIDADKQAAAVAAQDAFNAENTRLAEVRVSAEGIVPAAEQRAREIVDAAIAEAAESVARRDAAQAELATLEGKIAAAKDAVAKLLG